MFQPGCMAATMERAAGVLDGGGVSACAAIGVRGSRTIARASAARRRTGRLGWWRRARSLASLVIASAFHGGERRACGRCRTDAGAVLVPVLNRPVVQESFLGCGGECNKEWRRK